MRVTRTNGKFYARVGDFFGPLRSTANQALEALDKELDHYHPLNHTYLRTKDSTLLHVFQIPSHGWTINIIPSTGYKGEGRAGGDTFGKARLRAIELAKEYGGLVD